MSLTEVLGRISTEYAPARAEPFAHHPLAGR